MSITMNDAKRVCFNKDILSIMTLPEHIQSNIIQNMNMVEAMLLSKHTPHIKRFIRNIKWDNIKYGNAEKEYMLIQAFESIDINIIKILFDTIKYTDVYNINISEDIFHKIIEICYYKSFFDGIDFLAELKESHYINFKKHTFNMNNQYDLICEYIKKNSIDPRKVFLQLVISNNNIEMFDYVEKTYSYGLSLNFNNYKHKLCNASSNMIERIHSNLISQSNSSEIIEYYNNEMQQLSVRRVLIFQ